MEIEDWKVSQGDLMRIIQESVPGKQTTMAYIITSPDETIYKKLGLDPRADYYRVAIGVLTLAPGETAIITADLAIKASAIQIGFIDWFSGTLIIAGTISDINAVFERVLEYTPSELGFTVCRVIKAWYHDSKQGEVEHEENYAGRMQRRGKDNADTGHEGTEDNIPQDPVH